jgi:hypothetical protein
MPAMSTNAIPPTITSNLFPELGFAGADANGRVPVSEAGSAARPTLAPQFPQKFLPSSI